MKTRIIQCVSCVIMILLLTSCGSDTPPSNTLSYEETKSMVLDILKTEDGKKTIQEASMATQLGGQLGGGGGGAKMQMLGGPEGQQQLQLLVKEAVADPNFTKQMEKMMTDARFAGEFAKTVTKQTRQIHKDLMKDPEYQNQIIGIMKQADFEKMIMEVLKSPQYRAQTMKIMQESMQSPIYRLEMLNLMKHAIEEETKPKKGVATPSFK